MARSKDSLWSVDLFRTSRFCSGATG
jgi:hypothetical protein